jgi:hypothetical protein
MTVYRKNSALTVAPRAPVRGIEGIGHIGHATDDREAVANPGLGLVGSATVGPWGALERNDARSRAWRALNLDSVHEAPHCPEAAADALVPSVVETELPAHAMAVDDRRVDIDNAGASVFGDDLQVGSARVDPDDALPRVPRDVRRELARRDGHPRRAGAVKTKDARRASGDGGSAPGVGGRTDGDRVE